MLPVLGRTASPLGARGHGKIEQVDVGSKPGQEVDVFSQHAVHGFPEAVVSEPRVGHDEQGELVGMVDIFEHLSGLIQLGPKVEYRFAQADLPVLEDFLGVVETEVKRQASPAALDGCKQPDGDDVLGPGVTGLVLLGGMIEEAVAGEDLFADLGADAVIEGEEEASVGDRGRDGFSEGFPQAVPRDLGRGHEGVESSLGDVCEPEDGVETSQQVGCFRRGEGDDNGEEGVGKPGPAFFALSGMGKIIFELSEELV